MTDMKIDSKFGGLMISALVLIVFAQILPFIGGVMEDATPEMSATSEWNASYNTDLPSGADTWSTILNVLGGGLALGAIFWAISPIVGKGMGMS
jgi:hypothetical protein